MSPNLKPSRMPCFTQVLTRQPSGAAASGAAARPAPEESASRSPANAARARSRSADAPAVTSSLMSDSSIADRSAKAFALHDSLRAATDPIRVAQRLQNVARRLQPSVRTVRSHEGRFEEAQLLE